MQRLGQFVPSSIRPSWLYDVVRDLQLLASPDTPLTRARLDDLLRRLPPYSRLETIIMRGLLEELGVRMPVILIERDTPAALCHRAAMAREIRHLIDRHYAERLTIRRLGHMLRHSKTVMSAAFRETYGVTIHGYLTMKRASAAVQALQTSEEKVEAVAFESGYRSKKDLYRVIRAITGLTPGQLKMRKTGLNVMATGSAAAEAPARDTGRLPIPSTHGLRRP